MALDELNGANTLIGGRRARFELMSEDDQADPKSGVQAAQKLVDTGVRAVIGHYNSGVSIPAARVYQQAGIPMVTGASSNPQLTKLGYDHIFRLAANDNVMGAAMAEFAKSRGFKRIAVIDDRTAYGQGVAEVFIQTANRLGLTIVGREYTSDKAADFTPVLTKLRGDNPDVLFFGGYYAQAGVMARQVRQLGLRAVMMGGDGICSPEVIALGATQLEGRFFCAQGGRPLDALPGGPAYRERFVKAFKAPVDTYAPAFYVATLAVARAMQDAGSDDPKKFVPSLKAVRFDSLLGPVQFDPAGDWVNAPVSLYQIEGAKLTPLATAR
jgi:branched-chain amino acid transport system substrate-binding protein